MFRERRNCPKKEKKTPWEQKKNIWNESMTPNSLDRKLE